MFAAGHDRGRLVRHGRGVPLSVRCPLPSAKCTCRVTAGDQNGKGEACVVLSGKSEVTGNEL